MKNIGFIGCGNMATAIIKGICNDKENSIRAYDIDVAKVEALKDSGVVKAESPKELAEKSDFIFLAIKPQQFEEALGDLAGHTSGKVIVSIAAGITAEYIKSKLGEDTKVVLVMPNTPLLRGKGATALCKVQPTSQEEFNVVVNIFSQSGIAKVIPEDKMKEIIAINGSSPAFIYLFAQGFLDYAKKVDIDEKTALELFSQTLIGSADMMINSGFTVDELIKMVSSPGGTTLKGLESFDKDGLKKSVVNACEACTQRAYELSK